MMPLRNVLKVLAGWKVNNDVKMKLTVNVRNGDSFGILCAKLVIIIISVAYAHKIVLMISEMMDLNVLNLLHMVEAQVILGNSVMP
jgi:hypothetical protein